MVDIFTIITRSGRAVNCNAGTNYWDILDRVATDMSSAGSNWDAPNMLLLNGKVVIAENLSNYVWTYSKDMGEAIESCKR